MNDNSTPKRSHQGVRIHEGKLRRELIRRGWSANDLCRASGLSRTAVASALAGKAVKPVTLSRIVTVLAGYQPVEGIDEYF